MKMTKVFYGGGGYRSGHWVLERLWMDGQKGWSLYNEAADVHIDVFRTKREGVEWLELYGEEWSKQYAQ